MIQGLRRWRLTRQAEAAVADIARCRQIAAGTAAVQDCFRLIDPDLPEALRLARAGSGR